MRRKGGLLSWILVASLLTGTRGQLPDTPPGRLTSATRTMIKNQMRNILSGRTGYIPILSYLRVRGGSIANVSPAKPSQTRSTIRPGGTVNNRAAVNSLPLGTKYKWMYVVPNERRWLTRTQTPVNSQRTNGNATSNLPVSSPVSTRSTLPPSNRPATSILPVSNPVSTRSTLPPSNRPATSILPVSNPVSTRATLPPSNRPGNVIVRDPTENNGIERSGVGGVPALGPEAGDPLTGELADRPAQNRMGVIPIPANSPGLTQEAGDNGRNRDALPVVSRPTDNGALITEPGDQRRNSASSVHEAGDTGLNRDPVPVGIASQGSGNNGIEREPYRVNAVGNNRGVTNIMTTAGVVNGQSVVTGGAATTSNMNRYPDSGPISSATTTRAVNSLLRGDPSVMARLMAVNVQAGRGPPGVTAAAGPTSKGPGGERTTIWISKGAPGNLPSFYPALNPPAVQNVGNTFNTDASTTDGISGTVGAVTGSPTTAFRPYNAIYLTDLTQEPIQPNNGGNLSPSPNQLEVTRGSSSPPANGNTVIPVIDPSRSSVMFLYNYPTGYTNNPTIGSGQNGGSTPDSQGRQPGTSSNAADPQVNSGNSGQGAPTTSIQNPTFAQGNVPVSLVTSSPNFDRRTSPMGVPPGMSFTVGQPTYYGTIPPADMTQTRRVQVTGAQWVAEVSPQQMQTDPTSQPPSLSVGASENAGPVDTRTIPVLMAIPEQSGNAGSTNGPNDALSVLNGGQAAPLPDPVPQAVDQVTPPSVMAPPLLGADGQSLPNPAYTTPSPNKLPLETFGQFTNYSETTTAVNLLAENFTTTESSIISTTPYGSLNSLCGPHLVGTRDFPSTTTKVMPRTTTPRYLFPWLNPLHPEYEPPEPSEAPELEMGPGGVMVGPAAPPALPPLTPGMCFCSEKPECEGQAAIRGLPYEYQCDVAGGLTCCCEPG